MPVRRRRKKTAWDSAREAWKDVEEDTGCQPEQVIERDDSRSWYVWVLPDGC